jgi:hypothetical protein
MRRGYPSPHRISSEYHIVAKAKDARSKRSPFADGALFPLLNARRNLRRQLPPIVGGDLLRRQNEDRDDDR